MAPINISEGQQFGRLVVIREVRVNRTDRCQSGKRGFLCRCSCGTEVEVLASNLRSGNSTSCGCLFRERRAVENARRAAEGYKHHPLRNLHGGMKRRCLDPAHKDYPRYGALGVRVYAPWLQLARFVQDIEREIGPRPSQRHSLDRIDPTGNYEPGNVRWADPLTQRLNRRSGPVTYLSDAQAAEIQHRWANRRRTSVTQTQLAAEYRISQRQVSRIVLGQSRFGGGP